ncbi:MAG: GNAT family N-acetyltransferase [bacterium]|nr:GNAT family N-acetyltransferase [bacterium]
MPGIVEGRRRTRILVKAILDYYGAVPGARLHGADEDGRLACAALTADLSARAPFAAGLRLMLTVRLRLGRRAWEALHLAHARRPAIEGRVMEIVLLATDPASRRRGLGRAMLRRILAEAERDGFDGALLAVGRDSPAVRLYESEGFVAESSCSTGGAGLLVMRRDIAGRSPHIR